MESASAGGLMVDTGNLTKRQKEIFEYVKTLRAGSRLSADRA